MCFKIKSVALALVVFAPFSAQALSVSLFINDANATIVLPATGILTHTFTGIVTVNGLSDSNEHWVEYPTLAGGDDYWLSPIYSQDYIDALASFSGSNGGTYSGDLFSITVNSDERPGHYDHAFGSPEAPQLTLTVFDSASGKSAHAAGSFTVDIQTVPEPATLVLLGIPVAAWIKKRKLR